MSTYAAIFMKDDATGLYNGISVKYDGYVEGGVGEMLYRFWNDEEEVKKLCTGKRTDMRALGRTLQESEWFDDEPNDRYKSFRGLTMDAVIATGGYVADYIYVYEDYTAQKEWFLVDDGNSLELLADVFNDI